METINIDLQNWSDETATVKFFKNGKVVYRGEEFVIRTRSEWINRISLNLDSDGFKLESALIRRSGDLEPIAVAVNFISLGYWTATDYDDWINPSWETYDRGIVREDRDHRIALVQVLSNLV